MRMIRMMQTRKWNDTNDRRRRAPPEVNQIACEDLHVSEFNDESTITCTIRVNGKFDTWAIAKKVEDWRERRPVRWEIDESPRADLTRKLSNVARGLRTGARDEGARSSETTEGRRGGRGNSRSPSWRLISAPADERGGGAEAGGEGAEGRERGTAPGRPNPTDVTSRDRRSASVVRRPVRSLRPHARTTAVNRPWPAPFRICAKRSAFGTRRFPRLFVRSVVFQFESRLFVGFSINYWLLIFFIFRLRVCL